MGVFYPILGALAAAVILWFTIRTIKNNPSLFSTENFNKSFGTMGLLALGLIAFIAMLVLLLSATA